MKGSPGGKAMEAQMMNESRWQAVTDRLQRAARGSGGEEDP